MGNTEPTNPSNYNYTDISNENRHLKFAGKPDAAECYATFKSGGSPNGRINFLIHGAGRYQDPELADDADKKFASAAIYIPACTEWTHFTAEFEYNDSYTGYESVDEQRYILVSMTTNPQPGGSSGDVLTVDDIKLIYHSQLTSLSFNGTPIEGFNKDTYEYEVEGFYTQDCLNYTVNGQSATATVTYDEATSTATIKVSNVDTDEDGQTEHTYTVKITAPVELGLTSLAFGEQTQTVDAENAHYVFRGNYAEGTLTATPVDARATVKIDYNDETRVAAVTTEDGKGNASAPVYVKFAKADVVTYNAKMFIGLNGALIAATTPGLDGEAAIEISKPENGCVDFQLNDFTLEGIGTVGNIYVTDVPVVADGAKTTLSKEQTIRIFGTMGEALGDLPVVLTASTEGDALTAAIDIAWTPEDGDALPINVSIFPFAANVIDLSHVTVDDIEAETLRKGLTNPNCLIYVGSESTVEGTNIARKDGRGQLTIDTAYDIEIPYGFTAENVSLVRSFAKGWTTLCLPFNISAEELSEDAAAEEFNSYDAESGLHFTKVSGDLQARTPYLVWLPEAVDNFTFTNKTIEAGAPESVTFEGVTFAGNYAAAFPLEGLYTAVLAEATTGTLAAADASATLNATSAAFTLTEEAAAGSLVITLEECGAATGIDAAASAAKSTAAAVYDLSGRRVQTAAKGLYIIDGRKMIVK